MAVRDVSEEELREAQTNAQKFIDHARGLGLSRTKAAMALGVAFVAIAKRAGQELPTALSFVQVLWDRVEALPAAPTDVN